MLLVVGSMCVYMCGSRYITLKYKQYYTIYFLVCVSILFIVPEFVVSVRGITQKIIILHGAWILCVCFFHLGGWASDFRRFSK